MEKKKKKCKLGTLSMTRPPSTAQHSPGHYSYLMDGRLLLVIHISSEQLSVELHVNGKTLKINTASMNSTTTFITVHK